MSPEPLQFPKALSRRLNVTLAIILAQLAVFILVNVSRELRYGVLNLFALVPANVAGDARVWQLFSYSFVHLGFGNFFINMFGFFIFGAQVERRMKVWEYPLFYLVGTTGAGLVSLLVFWIGGSESLYLLDSTGALLCLLFAFALLNPETKVYVAGVLPLRAPLLASVYAGIVLINLLPALTESAAPLIHLSAPLFAFLFFLIRWRRNPFSVFRSAGRSMN